MFAGQSRTADRARLVATHGQRLEAARAHRVFAARRVGVQTAFAVHVDAARVTAAFLITAARITAARIAAARIAAAGIVAAGIVGAAARLGAVVAAQLRELFAAHRIAHRTHLAGRVVVACRSARTVVHRRRHVVGPFAPGRGLPAGRLDDEQVVGLARDADERHREREPGDARRHGLDQRSACER